jgi:glutathione synthase
MTSMRIGFVVNDLETEEEVYTTTRLALAATNAGHEAWILGVGDFAYDPDGKLRARAHGAPGKEYRSTSSYLSAVRGEKGKAERITVSDLDVLMLRNDPAEDFERPWAQNSGFIFGELAVRHGVLVLNDPGSLADAFNKMYFQHFPESVRPRTLITRDVAEIRAFVKKEKGRAVLKPLQGSGGANVFVLKPGEEGNLAQMADAITRDGYVVVQEYLRAAKEGDVRLFVMNGAPLEVNGKVAAFRRKPAKGESRSNMSVGGKAARVQIDDTMVRIVETVRPKLIADGMFLVGLDIVGDKLMEINVFSPGGLGSSQKLEGENFAAAVIEAIEKKLEYKQHYGTSISNKRLATM